MWQLGETEDVEDIQQEIHVASQQTEPWSWLVGFFYLDEVIKEHLLGEIISARSVIPTGLFSGDRTETATANSKALFGSLSYFLTDKIRISVGGRFTNDDKTYSQRALQGMGRGNVDFKKSFSEFTWKTGIDWFMTEEQMLYFTASTGFLAGGFNQFLPAPGNLVQSTDYKPETMLNFELGSKNRFFDDRLQVNAAIFYNDITDLQTFSFDFTIPVAVVDNSGSADTFGVELELESRSHGPFDTHGNPCLSRRLLCRVYWLLGRKPGCLPGRLWQRPTERTQLDGELHRNIRYSARRVRDTDALSAVRLQRRLLRYGAE